MPKMLGRFGFGFRAHIGLFMKIQISWRDEPSQLAAAYVSALQLYALSRDRFIVIMAVFAATGYDAARDAELAPVDGKKRRRGSGHLLRSPLDDEGIIHLFTQSVTDDPAS
jgi:hypothetical protein